MPPVKPSTPSKPSRADRAAATRRRMLDGARALFLTEGYQATTMEQIAAATGVAVQTVYYTFRTKGRLLREVVEVTAADDPDPVPVAERAWTREWRSSTSAQRVIGVAVEHGTAIYARAAPLWPAVRTAAATDPDVARWWQDVAAGRRQGQAAIVARIADLGALATTMSAERATDLLTVLFGHEVFQALVMDRGWAMAEYQAWLFTTLVDQLLDRPRPDPSALDGLSFAPSIGASGRRPRYRSLA